MTKVGPSRKSVVMPEMTSGVGQTNVADGSVVSTFFLNGHKKILSRYEDDIWRFVTNVTNRRISSQNVNFDSIPACFKESVKEIIWNYLNNGIPGAPRPGAKTVVSTFHNVRPFLVYLNAVGIDCISQATPMVCMAYANHVKSIRRLDGKERKVAGLHHRYTAVERIFRCSQGTRTPMPAHPWPETSAFALSGMLGGSYIKESKTPPIPDEIISKIFREASDVVFNSHKLLDMRDALVAIDADKVHLCRETGNYWKTKYLNKHGWTKGLFEFEVSVREIRDAAYIVVATLSGCRNHEICFLQNNSCYPTKHDGEVYWWMKSRSTKTKVGDAEWMIPSLAVRAIEVMERWAAPYQREIREELDRRASINPNDVEISDGQMHVNSIFLGKSLRRGMSYRTMSLAASNYGLLEFAKRRGIQWRLSTHQFRRTFALFAAQSQFGDLRYLKEHFKHWSMDMTLLYAMNEKQEVDLFEEIGEELDAIQLGVVDTCLNPDEPLSGGGGEHILAFRKMHPVEIKESRRQLVKTLAPTIRLRATGHGWCTADNDDCVGRTRFEMHRCSTCSNGVISRRHLSIYQEQFKQATELLKLKDIGESGRVHASRAIEGCQKVLNDLALPLVTGSLS